MSGTEVGRRWRVLGSRRRWLILIVLAGLCLLSAMRFVDSGGASQWATVERRDLAIEAEFSGELEAVRSIGYGPPPIPDVWEYNIAFLAPEGSEVEAGEPILGFDTTQLQQRLIDRQADREAAEKQLVKRQKALEIERHNNELALGEAKAKIDKARLKVDVPSDLIARQEWRTARIDLELAEEEARYRRAVLAYLDRIAAAEVEAMRQERDRRATRVREIESKIDQMTVRAQTGGTVVYKADWQGNKKKVGDRVWRAEIVVFIPDLSEMMATIEVDEARAGKLSVGLPASFRLDAYPERTYEARVSRIARVVEQRSPRDPRRVVRLDLELEATDVERMRPGMRLEGAVVVDRVDGVLALPLAAVESAAERARVRSSSTFGQRWLYPELGRRNDKWVEVLSGLEEGDKVALGSAG